ncbi:sodium:proton antiporter NhaD [Rhodopseudomonas sp. B29]|uniref:sodium:proton antiporter NhaD n=1 Tax=Rhodopseudomonas sp. B29 TaxID=95607 RepID=UPI00034D0F4D|nr:sodium:proton antiporter NhaD [Rhodopseudomonas sp. B29]
MNAAIIAVFVGAYAAIAFEHPVRINKAAVALVGAGLLWSIYSLASPDTAAVQRQLDESIATTAQIVFFLIGAMTIVEVVDAHNGFEVVTSLVRTSRQSTLLWLIGFTTFFLSAMLDNLTTTIVMVSLVRKLLARDKDRLLYASIIVIAANAGGAWSPIGDVTTTMLWIGGQITALAIIKGVFAPSFINLLIPLAITSYRVGDQPIVAPATPIDSGRSIRKFERNLMFVLGLGVLVAVPAFKALTHLPPFMGILFGLGILWTVGELLHRDKPSEEKSRLTLAHALTRIDMASVVFFIGILLAVATLEHSGLLAALASWLGTHVGRLDVIVMLLGLASAVVDNVPLVAAAMGMYGMAQHPPDSFLWHFIAYSAGTGGSILIIGSAAGIAAMGLEKIHFLWYLRKVSGLALIAYLAGCAAYILQYQLLG